MNSSAIISRPHLVTIVKSTLILNNMNKLIKMYYEVHYKTCETQNILNTLPSFISLFKAGALLTLIRISCRLRYYKSRDS